MVLDETEWSNQKIPRVNKSKGWFSDKPLGHDHLVDLGQDKLIQKLDKSDNFITDKCTW